MIREMYKDPLTQFLRDVRHNPDSFKGLDYQTLLKAIKDIENQSFHSRMEDVLVIAFHYKPKYRADIMVLNKPGFKDLPPNKKFISGVVIDMFHMSTTIERIQLVIHASKARPVNLAIRYRNHGWTNWAEVPCTSSTVLTVYRSIVG